VDDGGAEWECRTGAEELHLSQSSGRRPCQSIKTRSAYRNLSIPLNENPRTQLAAHEKASWLRGAANPSHKDFSGSSAGNRRPTQIIYSRNMDEKRKVCEGGRG
jgi:hypothetical protein